MGRGRPRRKAFSSTVAGGVRIRKELNHLVFWFAHPAADDLYPGSGAPTPFGDGVAGSAAMLSRNALHGAPLPDMPVGHEC